jgi:hypothetical protein
MKNKFVLTLLLVTISVLGFAQNPYKYDSKIVLISIVADQNWLQVYGDPFPNSYKSVRNENRNSAQSVFNEVCKYYNDRGYRAVAVTNLSSPPTYQNERLIGNFQYQYLFEKSDSYRETELYKLINELTTRIDVTSKKYTDSAMVVIQTNVLNYLKSIPNEVITQAYKDELTKLILSEADDKLKKVVEELKNEIRNSSTGNN